MKGKNKLHGGVSIRILVVLIILFAVVASVVSYINQNNIRRVYEENYTERVLLVNSLIASYLNSDEVAYYVELLKNQDDGFKQRQVQFYHDRDELFRLHDEGASQHKQQDLLERLTAFHRETAALKDERYWEIIEELRNLQETSMSSYVYVLADTGLRARDGEKLYTFIFDSHDSDAFDINTTDGLGTCDVGEDYLSITIDSRTQMNYVQYYEGVYGELYYAYAPILDDNGNVIAVLGSDLALGSMNELISSSTWLFNIVFFIFFAVTVLSIFLYLKHDIINPLHSLTDTAREISDGNLDTIVSESVLRQRGEMGILAHTMKEAIEKSNSDFKHLTQMQESLLEQNMRLNLLIGSMDIALWDADANYSADSLISPENEIYYSKEFINMLGFSGEDEFPCILRSWFNQLHPDDFDKVIGAFHAHIDDITNKTPFDTQFRMRLKNGQYKWFRAFGATLRDNDGMPIRMIGATEDINDKKNAEHKIEEALHKAESANHAKSAFLANMSHEIRTPMNAILGITEIELKKEHLPPDTSEALSKIYDSGDLLLSIINDILDFSKIEEGKLEILPADYCFPNLINETIQLNTIRFDNKLIDFKLNVDPDIPLNLHGDKLRIKQILGNILSNAFKYTDKGEVKLTVSSEQSRINDEFILIFSVSDTGIGMTDDQLGKLFKEYTRFNLNVNRTIPGTGLGMSITKRLLDLMDGKISVESEINKGSVFTVRIPQKRVDDAVCGQKVVEQLQSFHYHNLTIEKENRIPQEIMPHGKVLIVDDISSNLYVTKGMLKPYGLQIDTAKSGFESIEKVKSGKVYDIIFMDYMMPGMNGMEATQILRDMGYAKPIVALTANALTGQAKIFLENGFDYFISKPIDSRELDMVLHKYIDEKKDEK